MTRGIKPAPTNLKLLRGARPGRINSDEPQPNEGVPVCPSRNPAVRAVWDYTIVQLLAMRTVTMADRDPLHGYCQSVVLFEQASALMEAEGIVKNTNNGMGRTLPHPAQKIQREAANQLRAFAQEFGLTPSARTRIRVGDQKPKEQQGASRLLSG